MRYIVYFEAKYEEDIIVLAEYDDYEVALEQAHMFIDEYIRNDELERIVIVKL